MKKILSLLVLFLCVGTPAAMAAGSKIAYVDTQAVLEKTKYGQKTQGIIREYYENRKKILDMDEDELRKLIEDYKKQESVLNEKAKNEKRELISRKDGEFRKKEAQFNDELRRKQAELFNEFDQKLSEILKEVAKKEKADLVISKSLTLPQVEQKLVLYAEEGLDLTQKVIEEMDKKEAAKN
jgi:Skp family chaperone for outer membrane proteins